VLDDPLIDESGHLVAIVAPHVPKLIVGESTGELSPGQRPVSGNTRYRPECWRDTRREREGDAAAQAAATKIDPAKFGWGIALTGLVMGLGSNPTHEVIKAVTEFKKQLKG
jgi:hypothetical protein